MKLYIFDETTRAAAYGIGSYLCELIVALKGSKIHVCIVHLRSDQKDMEQSIDIDSVNHLYIPAYVVQNNSLTWNQQSELYYRNVVFLLQLHIVDREKMVFHLNYNQCGVLAEELKKVFDCTIITSVHFLNWCFLLSGNISRFRKMLLSAETGQEDELKTTVNRSYLMEKKYFDSVDHIICLSKKTQIILQNEYQIKPGKINVIYNGLTDRISIADKSSLRQKYRIPDIPVILFVGRIDEIKGLKYALQAFKKVLLAYPNCHFIIAGSGSFDEFMKECEDIWMNITWTGLIDKDRVFDLYSIADFGVIPSFHEQCSYVAKEMMMHGVPVIGSTTTGLEEMIIDGETGLHIPVIEYEEHVDIDTDFFAEKMLYLLLNEEERIRMGVNARKRYEIQYSADIFSEKMINFYLSI